MCELLGFSGKQEYKVEKLLLDFYEHALTNNQKDGWGLASYKAGKKKPFLVKGATSAHKSKHLYKLLEKGVVSHLTIGHLRFASKGAPKMENTHPFIQKVKSRNWVLAHNGTLFSKFYNGARKPTGSTDSEKILCRISDGIERNLEGSLYKNIESSIEDLEGLGTMNLLFTEGERLFVYCNKENALYINNKYKGCVIIMTKPLEPICDWEPVKMNKLLVYKDGKKIHEGRKSYVTERWNWEKYGAWEENKLAELHDSPEWRTCLGNWNSTTGKVTKRSMVCQSPN